MSKVDVKIKHDFCTLISLEECKALIRALVADLAVEHAALRAAQEHPTRIDEATLKLLGLGPNHGMSSLEMARARVMYFEEAQDRLWDWYKRLSNGR